MLPKPPTSPLRPNEIAGYISLDPNGIPYPQQEFRRIEDDIKIAIACRMDLGGAMLATAITYNAYVYRFEPITFATSRELNILAMDDIHHIIWTYQSDGCPEPHPQAALWYIERFLQETKSTGYNQVSFINSPTILRGSETGIEDMYKLYGELLVEDHVMLRAMMEASVSAINWTRYIRQHWSTAYHGITYYDPSNHIPPS